LTNDEAAFERCWCRPERCMHFGASPAYTLWHSSWASDGASSSCRPPTRRCRVPGCNRRRYVDVHHLVARADGGEHSRRNCITLCSTHHRLLHEGKLLITGNADAEPVFLDAARQTVASFGEQGRFASRQGRHASDGECAAPRAQRERQSNEPGHGIHDGATQLGSLNESALHLLQIMGRRGNWNSDVLVERSGLPFPELQHALLLLELEGRVRRRGCEFDPV
jgi:hypothetical protein